jgi:hypothetical protein
MFIKIVWIFSFFSLACCSKHLTNEDVKSFSNALDAIVKDQYVGKEWQLDFYTICKPIWCRKFAQKVIDNVLKMNRGEIKIGLHILSQIINQNLFKSSLKLSNSAVFFIQNYEDIITLDFPNDVMTNRDYVKFHHTVVLLGDFTTTDLNPEMLKLEQYSNIVSKFSKLHNYEVFIFKQKKNIKMMTIQHFDPSKSCKSTLKNTNEFSIKKQKWQNKNLGLIKHEQFNGCTVKVPLYSEDNVMLSVIYEIYEIFGSNFNTTIEKINMMTTNPTSLFDEKIDQIILIGNSERINWDFEDSFSYTFFENEIGFVVPVGEEYTSYEKFVLPFDSGTWICCGVFFGGAFVIIFIIHRTRNRHIQRVVFGDRVQSPSFNILVAFFGQSQNILPSRSFARFLLMSFILFCLIIRTGYQGVQFDMMYKVRKLITIKSKKN